MKKVIIAGSRSFEDYDYLREIIDHLIDRDDPIEIISGGAKGSDKLGEKYAEYYGISVKQFFPDWHKYGKSAGFIRNKEMAEYADVLIAFWDGKSKGTKHMIDLALKYKLKTHIIFF